MKIDFTGIMIPFAYNVAYYYSRKKELQIYTIVSLIGLVLSGDLCLVNNLEVNVRKVGSKNVIDGF